MLIPILIFVITVEFLLVFFISRKIFALLYLFFYLPLKHDTLAKNLTTILFLPGTIIHEFAHAGVAKLLGVKVGKIMIYPHKDQASGEMKAGSVELKRADLVRMSIIGTAPLVVGIVILTAVVYYLFGLLTSFSNPQLFLPRIWETLMVPVNYLLFLLIFIVSTTMFTSKKDVREFMILLPILIALFILCYYLGFRIELTTGLVSNIAFILTPLSFVMGVTLIVDFLVFIFLFIPISLLLYILSKVSIPKK